jgi:hypothetical protein
MWANYRPSAGLLHPDSTAQQGMEMSGASDWEGKKQGPTPGNQSSKGSRSAGLLGSWSFPGTAPFPSLLPHQTRQEGSRAAGKGCFQILPFMSPSVT